MDFQELLGKLTGTFSGTVRMPTKQQRKESCVHRRQGRRGFQINKRNKFYGKGRVCMLTKCGKPMEACEIRGVKQQFVQLIRAARSRCLSNVFPQKFNDFACVVRNLYGAWVDQVTGFIDEQSRASNKKDMVSLYNELKTKIWGEMCGFARIAACDACGLEKKAFTGSSYLSKNLAQTAIGVLDQAWMEQSAYNEGRNRKDRPLNKQRAGNADKKKDGSRKNLVPQYRPTLLTPNTTKKGKGPLPSGAGYAKRKRYADQLRKKKAQLETISQYLYRSDLPKPREIPRKVDPAKKARPARPLRATINLDDDRQENEDTMKKQPNEKPGLRKQFYPIREGFRYYQQPDLGLVSGTAGIAKNPTPAHERIRRCYKVRRYKNKGTEPYRRSCVSTQVPMTTLLWGNQHGNNWGICVDVQAGSMRKKTSFP